MDHFATELAGWQSGKLGGGMIEGINSFGNSPDRRMGCA
jgi:hypothetical protein